MKLKQFNFTFPNTTPPDAANIGYVVELVPAVSAYFRTSSVVKRNTGDALREFVTSFANWLFNENSEVTWSTTPPPTPVSGLWRIRSMPDGGFRLELTVPATMNITFIIGGFPGVTTETLTLS